MFSQNEAAFTTSKSQEELLKCKKRKSIIVVFLYQSKANLHPLHLYPCPLGQSLSKLQKSSPLNIGQKKKWIMNPFI